MHTHLKVCKQFGLHVTRATYTHATMAPAWRSCLSVFCTHTTSRCWEQSGFNVGCRSTGGGEYTCIASTSALHACSATHSRILLPQKAMRTLKATRNCINPWQPVGHHRTHARTHPSSRSNMSISETALTCMENPSTTAGVPRASLALTATGRPRTTACAMARRKLTAPCIYGVASRKSRHFYLRKRLKSQGQD